MKVQESNNSVISREIADRPSLQQAKVCLWAHKRAYWLICIPFAALSFSNKLCFPPKKINQYKHFMIWILYYRSQPTARFSSSQQNNNQHQVTVASSTKFCHHRVYSKLSSSLKCRRKPTEYSSRNSWSGGYYHNGTVNKRDLQRYNTSLW